MKQRKDADKRHSAPQRSTGSRRMDELQQQSERGHTRKPGSQSQSNTSRHNNGRGGGK